MDFRVTYHLEALDEWDDAIAYYTKVAEEGVPARLNNEINGHLDIIVQTPYIFQTIAPDTRKAVHNTFPYSILFQVYPNEILIVAIAHAKRRPFYWISRLPASLN